eukprot:CFRG3867T1
MEELQKEHAAFDKSYMMDTGSPMKHTSFSPHGEVWAQSDEKSFSTMNEMDTALLLERRQVEEMSELIERVNMNLKIAHENLKIVLGPISETENVVDAWIQTFEKAHSYTNTMHDDSYPPTFVPMTMQQNDNESGNSHRQHSVNDRPQSQNNTRKSTTSRIRPPRMQPPSLTSSRR